MSWIFSSSIEWTRYSGSRHSEYVSLYTYKKKIYIICGSEFGFNIIRPSLIVKTLYGIISSELRFRDHLVASLRNIGFKSYLADPDVLKRPGTKPNGFE